jgi:hypothetical protein
MSAVDEFYQFFNAEDDACAVVDNNDLEGFSDFDEDFEIVEFRDRVNSGVASLFYEANPARWSDLEFDLEPSDFFMYGLFSPWKNPEPRPLDIHDPSTWNFSFEHKKGYWGGWRFGKAPETCEHHRHLEDNSNVDNIQNVSLNVVASNPVEAWNVTSKRELPDPFTDNKYDVDNFITENTSEENAIFNVEHVDQDISDSFFEPITYDESNYYNLGGMNSVKQNISDLAAVDEYTHNNKQQSCIDGINSGSNDVDSDIDLETAAGTTHYTDNTDEVAVELDSSKNAAEDESVQS